MSKRQWEHNPLCQVTGAPAAAGKPDAYAWEKDNTQHIVYLGADSHIHEIWYRKGLLDNKWNYGGSLSEKTGAPQADSNPNGYVWEKDNSQHIIYRGTDNQIHEIWQRQNMLKTGEWEYGGSLTQRANAPAGIGNPYAYAWEKDKSQHVIYRSADGDVHELWFEHGAVTSGDWKYGGAINSKVGALAAAGDPAGYAWEKDKTQHIVYRGTDNQVYELWFREGFIFSNWKYEKQPLTTMVGAPPAAGDPMGYAWEEDDTQHVVYLGQDDQIHEIYFKRSDKKWAYGGSMTQKVGAPPAAGNPMGYTWEDDNTQHIIYRGTDGHIHELWQRKALLSGHNWQYGGSLTEAASAPLAESDPFGFAWEKDDTQHIVYRGTDSMVHELWYRK